ARDGLTLQLTTIEGGEGLNTVASTASVTGDIRAATADDLAWAIEQVTTFGEHDGVELAFEDLGGPPAFERTAEVAALAQTAIALGDELGHAFGEALTGGVSDG